LPPSTFPLAKCMLFAYTKGMFIEIDPDSPTPIYQQISESLRQLIAQGKLMPGNALPSVRQLAIDLGVNLNTVATAYRTLQDQGLITIRHGSGAVVSSAKTIRVDEEKLKRAFSTAVIELLLSGMNHTQIFSLLKSELSRLPNKSR
jgi:GntR family transcriptional regulator